MKAIRAAGWVVLLLLNLFCFAAMFIGMRFGVSHGYRIEDWVSILVPNWRDEGELSAWFYALPLVIIPLATAALAVSAVLKRRRA